MRRLGGPVVVTVVTAVLAAVVLWSLWQAREETRTAIARQQLSIDTAVVHEAATDVVIALMAERGRSDAVPRDPAAVRVAQEIVDAAIADLERVVRSRPAVSDSSAADVLAALDQLTAIRSAEEPGDSYSLLIAAMITSLREGAPAVDADALANRRASSSLVDLLASLGQQRRLVAALLTVEPEGATAARTELALTADQADAAHRRYVRELERLGDLPAPLARDDEMRLIVDQVLAGEAPDLDLDGWWSVSSASIAEVRAELGRLTDALVQTRRADIGRFEDDRRLDTVAMVAASALLLTVATSAWLAAAHRRRAEAEHRELAVGIQQWFHATALPDIDGVEHAAAYQPASDHALAGGDWYDLFATDGGIVCIVGDAVGHGPQATADMARVRHLLRGIDVAGDLAHALHVLEGRLGDPPAMATVAVVVIEPALGRLRYHRAGHPPPLVRRADGTVQPLDGCVGPPVGAGFDRVNGTDGTDRAAFGSGDVLVLYSDGLVERRGTPLDESIGELAATIERGPGDPSGIVSTLIVERRADRDDVVILAVGIGEVAAETPSQAV